MLVRFRVENYRSLRDKIELSMAATSLTHDGPNPVLVEGIPNGLLRVAAIYGANASGKSNVLKAINSFSAAVANSHKKWKPEGPIPVEPFLLDESKEKPSLFEAEFVLADARYRYGFVIDRSVVREEWLYAFPSGRKIKKQEWFTREINREPIFRFGRNLAGENRVIEKITRPNSLFLSAAAQNNHQQLLPIYEWISKNIELIGVQRRGFAPLTTMMCDNETTKEAILGLLSPADLGVTGIRVTEEEIPEDLKKVMKAVKDSLSKGGGFDLEIPQKLPHVELLHTNRSGTEVALPMEDESDGTSSLFSLLGPVVHALATGGVLCVDELDASLHPLLSLEIVRMFVDPARNPKGAQLIFNTHDTNLLDEALLRRDEIWFTEKDSEGATHLYPLSDYTPRKGENLKRGYLQGRFGAIPFLNFRDHVTSEDNR
jgi:AAA15 family ATPase/GTPase